MLIVAALGAALLRRGQPLTAAEQREYVRIAARSLAPVALKHRLVVATGNGSQIAPHDTTLVAMLEHEIGMLLPFDRSIATVLTTIEVDAKDPAFRNPTTFIGPVFAKDDADRIAAERGWAFGPEGERWRRVLASPEPKRVVELQLIKCLLERSTVVVAASAGSGAAVHGQGAERPPTGIECVIDSDLATALLARDLNADRFVLLTDVNAVYIDWGKPTQRAIRRATPEALASTTFATCPMASKIEVACRFVRATGKQAAIGDLSDLGRILAAEAGTTIAADAEGIDLLPRARPERMPTPRGAAM
jgi:carbamate kinase